MHLLVESAKLRSNKIKDYAKQLPTIPNFTSNKKIILQKFTKPLEKYEKIVRQNRRWHILAQPGEPVKAIGDGDVAFSGWLRGLGFLVILDHGDGVMSLYGHNDSLYVRQGEKILQGDTLALVGQSGGVSKSGLYLEIRKDGLPTDPSDWLR